MFHLMIAAFAMWSAFIVIMVYIALTVLLIYKTIAYILESIGLMRIAKKEGYSYPFTAWFPVFSQYILGKYSYTGDDDASTTSGLIYSLLTIIKIVFLVIVSKVDLVQNPNYLGIALVYFVIYFVVEMIYMNKFYKKVYKYPTAFTIMTIVSLGLLKPIFIFASKGKDKDLPIVQQ